MAEETSKKNKTITTTGSGGRGYDARKGYAITGDYINNQPIFCETMQQARELFCTIAADKHCLKANVYFREHEKDSFLKLVMTGKYRQAMEFWGELVCEDELRIIKGTMIVPSYSHSRTNTPTTTTARATTKVVSGHASEPPKLEKSLEEQRAEIIMNQGTNSDNVLAAAEAMPQLSLPEPPASNDKGEVA